MDKRLLINVVYLACALMFIFGLKMLSSPRLARRGNLLSALGMLLAIAVTLLGEGLEYRWLAVAMIAGSIVGVLAARLVTMTQMPEMVALFNGFGGLASLLVGWAAWQVDHDPHDLLTTISTCLAILIGGVTFTGSLVAFAKLGELIKSKPVLFKAQQIVNALLLIAVLLAGAVFVAYPGHAGIAVAAMIVLSLVLGILSVIPIGGADMPVVISLLNSYSGLAGCAAGFVVHNNLLIVAGALVGASGIILTNIMCKAMNRSLTNVLFSGFGSVTHQADTAQQGEVKAININDAYLILEAARSVIFVPGYGMAVAQAQHAVRELSDLLEANGAEVRFAIHPVAGRMPGHMNVLLAEANVPYEMLVEPEAVNPSMATVDVAVVIGANDVVNPAAREDPSSPIYGMPIINVDEARTVFVLKRSMSAGFAGVPNPLFYKENTRMLFGDAKASISGLVAEFKG